MYILAVVCFLIAAHDQVKGQGNPAFQNDPESINAGQVFYFDKSSDCNGPKHNIYNSEVTIRGSDLSTTKRGPKSCTIILIVDRQFSGIHLEIQAVAMNILDPGTDVSIYDGEGQQVLLRTYDSSSSQNQNRMRLITSGSAATFVMSRNNVNNFNFDIEIKVRPISGGPDPGWENNYNRDNPFAFDKFDQDAIVGIVGGFYALVYLVCLGVVVYWYRTFNGMNKEWETHQLAALKTGSVFGTTSQKAEPAGAWSVDLQPPPHSRMGPSSHFSRKTGPPSEDWDSPGPYNEERFETRRLTNEKNGARPRYATTNFSYSDREEDDPDHFEEKVITPRPRAINGRRGNRIHRPPSYEEAVSDNASERSSDEYSSDASVGKKSLSSEEASSRRTRSSRSETPTQSESEDSRSGSESSNSTSRRRKRRNRAQGAKGKRPPPAKSHRSRAGRDSSNASDGGTTRSSHKPRAAKPSGMQPMPYGAPGPFVPIMAAPYPMVPGYPPPQYPQDRQQPSQHHSQPHVVTTDPPVYSYLVQRGYTPLDQLSAASHPSTQASLNPEEPETRLASGVDYMRR